MNQMNKARSSLKRAIKKMGGPKALGKAIGISGPAVSQWEITPHERVPAVSKATGIPRWDLRPDLYEKPR